MEWIRDWLQDRLPAMRKRGILVGLNGGLDASGVAYLAVHVGRQAVERIEARVRLSTHVRQVPYSLLESSAL